MECEWGEKELFLPSSLGLFAFLPTFSRLMNLSAHYTNYASPFRPTVSRLSILFVGFCRRSLGTLSATICERSSRAGFSSFLNIFGRFLGARKTYIGLGPLRNVVAIGN